jgi:hypothetical protein
LPRAASPVAQWLRGLTQVALLLASEREALQAPYLPLELRCAAQRSPHGLRERPAIV